jgi:hypothetical protein
MSIHKRIKTTFGSSLPPVACVCLRVVVYNISCLCFCFVCLRLVYPVLPVSLNCPVLIAPSVFSNVYLSCVPCVACFS